MTRRQSLGHGQPSPATSLTVPLGRAPALLQSKGSIASCSTPRPSWTQEPWKFCKEEFPSSAKPQRHVTTSNADVQNTVFFRKGCNFLVIGKWWSPCTCFAYQVIFQCQGLFCFSLPSHRRFKSCSWHQGCAREAVPTAGTGAETARCLPGTKSYFLSISTALSSWGCVRACLQGHHGLAAACSSRKVTFPLLLQGKESRHGHQGTACGLAVAAWDRLTCRGSTSVAAAVG